MKKTLRFLIAILILSGGVNLMQLTNPKYFSVEAYIDQRIILSRPISISPSHPIRPSQPIKPPTVRPSRPIN